MDCSTIPIRFDAVSIGLHWASVILIAALFASASSLGLTAGGDADQLLTLDRSLGVTLWILAIGRLAWRLTLARRLPPTASAPPVQSLAARLSEYALYALMLAQPPTCLAQSVARGRSFQLFLFQAPKLMARDKPLVDLFHETHELIAWILLALIGLHVAAVLFHRLIRRDGVVQSMLPWPPSKAPRE